MTRLEQFGWQGPVEGGIARIVSAHGDYYHLICNEAEGEILARKKKSAFRDHEVVKPITGDYVRFIYNANGESMITEVLPRFSKFERKDPTARRQAQTLAVNFDTLFIMMALNGNFSVPRLERFLTLANDVGEAEVVVVLTKADLPHEEPPSIAVPSLKISAKTGEGIAELSARYVKPRSTVAFIGSSGVGKSTLLNTLAGEEWAATGEIQEWSGKGRHTTTSRELVRLDSGALILDTPGIREIGRLGETEIELTKGFSTHRYRIK